MSAKKVYTEAQAQAMVRDAVWGERVRCLAIVEKEVHRAEALRNLEQNGEPVFDPGMMNAGISALRTVMEPLQFGERFEFLGENPQ